MRWNRFLGAIPIFCGCFVLISTDARSQPDIQMDVYGTPPKQTLYADIPKSKEYPNGRKIFIDTIKAQVQIDNFKGLSEKLFGNPKIDGSTLLFNIHLEFTSEIDDKLFDFSFDVDGCMRLDPTLLSKKMMYCTLLGAGEGRKGGFAIEPIFKNGFAEEYKLHFGKIFKNDVSELPADFDNVPATLQYTSNWKENTVFLKSFNQGITTVEFDPYIGD